jgi:hypothetical protein
MQYLYWRARLIIYSNVFKNNTEVQNSLNAENHIKSSKPYNSSVLNIFQLFMDGEETIYL